MNWKTQTADYINLQAELDQEYMQEWADAHSCGACERFFTDGPFEKGEGICLARSGMFNDELDLYFVSENDYHEECFGD